MSLYQQLGTRQQGDRRTDSSLRTSQFPTPGHSRLRNDSVRVLHPYSETKLNLWNGKLKPRPHKHSFKGSTNRDVNKGSFKSDGQPEFQNRVSSFLLHEPSNLSFTKQIRPAVVGKSFKPRSTSFNNPLPGSALQTNVNTSLHQNVLKPKPFGAKYFSFVDKRLEVLGKNAAPSRQTKLHQFLGTKAPSFSIVDHHSKNSLSWNKSNIFSNRATKTRSMFKVDRSGDGAPTAGASHRAPTLASRQCEDMSPGANDRFAQSRNQIINLMKNYSKSFVQSRNRQQSTSSQSKLNGIKLEEPQAEESADEDIAHLNDPESSPALINSPQIPSIKSLATSQRRFEGSRSNNGSQRHLEIPVSKRQATRVNVYNKVKPRHHLVRSFKEDSRKQLPADQPVRVIMEENSESEGLNGSPPLQLKSSRKPSIKQKRRLVLNPRRQPDFLRFLFKKQDLKGFFSPRANAPIDASTQKPHSRRVKPSKATSQRHSHLRPSFGLSFINLSHSAVSKQTLPKTRKLCSTLDSFPGDDELAFEKTLGGLSSTEITSDNRLHRYHDLISRTVETVNHHSLLLETKFYFYMIERLIDKGAYGRVFVGRSVLANAPVAIKCFDIDGPDGPQNLAQIQEELAIMRSLKHANVIRLLDSFRTTHFYYLVIEYAPAGNLLCHIQDNGIFEEDEFMPYFTQIVQGLLYLRSKKILHRDIKLENMLLFPGKIIKICDFGISKKMEVGTKITEHIGTPAYIAPEVILEEGYADFKVDVWSLGVLAYIALTGEIPFDGNTIEELRLNILQQPLVFPGDVLLTERMRNLLTGMLEKDPPKRMGILEVAAALGVDISSGQELEDDWDAHKIARIVRYGFNERVVMGHLHRESANHIKALYELV